MKKVALNSSTNIDLEKLIESKLLIQANSGGGKSWLIRRILEQSHGKVQQIIIDPEGEFGTLREKHDYILCGKGGDAPAEPRSAAILAHKLLEHKASAIIDLYELHPQERKHFVHLFVDALVDAPKELWNDCLVVIDEAHDFVPEKGESEAANAVIGLAAKGRKRGFCAILATQRISKLHKDAAAECNNKLIGRSTLDIDRKRASEELGFTTKEESLSLRTMKPGEFYAFGPALSDEVKKIQIGEVKTAHPKVGSRSLNKVTPPSENIKKVLSKLGDLPKEAEKEAKTTAELKEKIRVLERQVKQPQVVQGAPTRADIDKALEPHIIAIKSERMATAKLISNWEEFIDGMYKTIKNNAFTIIRDLDEMMKNKPSRKPAGEWIMPKYTIGVDIASKGSKDKTVAVVMEHRSDGISEVVASEKLGLCERKVYSFLATNPHRSFTKVQVGAVTGYSPTSGGFNNAIARLNSAGLIQRTGDGLIISGNVDSSLLLEGEEFSAEPRFWRKKLGACENKVYEYLWQYPDLVISKEQVGEVTGYSPTSGGFNNAIARLNSIGLIRREHGGLRINQELLNI